MQRILMIISVIVGYIFLAAILYGIYHVLAGILNIIPILNPNVVTSIVAALTAFFGFLYNQKKAKERDISEAHRPQKVELYKQFMNIVVDLQTRALEGKLDEIQKDEMPKELVEKMIGFTCDLIVWGSPDVIKKWDKFRCAAAQASPNMLFVMDEMLQSIRKDLGNSNFLLKKGDLIKLFLRDPSELDRAITGSRANKS